MEEQHHQEQEIDLLELLGVLLKKWYIIAGTVVTVMLFVGSYAYGVMEDVYTAETSILVQVRSEGEEGFDYQLGERLVNTYTEIATSPRVLSELQDEVENEFGAEYSLSAFRDMIEVTGVEQTVVIKLGVEAEDPSEAVFIANELVRIMDDTSSQFDGLDNIEILNEASMPENPSGPNRMLYLAVAFVLGGMIGTFIVLGFEYLDKSIKTTRDVEQRLGLRVLGAIPEYDLESEVEE
ncbi:MAG: YveK family protein [Candidatus Izemoplasmataceae bacterium]